MFYKESRKKDGDNENRDQVTLGNDFLDNVFLMEKVGTIMAEIKEVLFY